MTPRATASVSQLTHTLSHRILQLPAAWRLLDKQAALDLQLAKAGGEGAEEAGKRYERWANAREESVKKKAQEALNELTETFH